MDTRFGDRVAAATVRPARESAAGLHAAASGLQQCCRPGGDSQTPIANLFRFPISSPDRWEDNLWLTISKRKSEGFDLQRYLGVVRRRHLQFLIPLFLGWAVVWGASWVLPPRYVSSTLILVEQPTMPKDYVTPNVNDDLQERMQSITQQILEPHTVAAHHRSIQSLCGPARPAVARPEG